MIVSHVSARPKAVRRASGFVLVTLCLLTSGQRKLKWREQANALIERIVGGWSASRTELVFRSTIAADKSPYTRNQRCGPQTGFEPDADLCTSAGAKRRSHLPNYKPITLLSFELRSYSQMAEQLDISAPLKLFYSYAREDESFRDEMSKAVQLVKRQGLIEETYDGDVHGGMNWGHEIRSKLESADVIALLVSPDFIASDYCYGKEMPRALERSSRGEATVVPIILRPTDLTDAPFNHLQYLPKNKLPVSMWTDRESAYQDIAVGVRTIVGRIKHRRAETVQALNPDTDAVEDRVLDAAVAGEIPVDEAREVAIQVRLAASEGLRLCIKEDLLRGDTGRSYSAYPDDVRSSQLFSIPWSRKGLLQGDMDLSLRLSPSDIVVGQPEKNIKVAAIRDSGVFTFLIKACLEGTYYLNAELLCGDTSLAERMLRTKAKTHNLPPSGPGLVGQSVVASVPLAVRAVVKAAFA